jgi:hypothetical protein
MLMFLQIYTDYYIVNEIDVMTNKNLCYIYNDYKNEATKVIR